MFIPMILEVLPGHFKSRAALLHPSRGASSIPRDQTPDIMNPLAFGNNTGLSQHPMAQSESDASSLSVGHQTDALRLAPKVVLRPKNRASAPNSPSMRSKRLY